VLYNKFGIGCTDIEMAGGSYVMISANDLIGRLRSFPGSLKRRLKPVESEDSSKRTVRLPCNGTIADSTVYYSRIGDRHLRYPCKMCREPAHCALCPETAVPYTLCFVKITA
jgi:hypothetical protein